MKNITFIYLIESDNGLYIGKTVNPKIRRNLHSSKKQIKINDYTIIDQINSINRNDWKPLECFWIQYFKFLGFNILNKNKGGSGPESMDLKTKQLIGNKNRHPKPEGFGEKISKALKGKRMTKNWSPSEEHIKAIKKANSKPNSEETKIKISNSLLNNGGNILISQKAKERFKINGGSKLKKQIEQIDPINNNIIKIWESRTILINNGYTGIIYALSNPHHIYKGYYWKYKTN